MPLDPRRLRDALGQFPTGVVVATAISPAGERLGMTMSSFNSVSLDPPLVLFSVHRSALSFAAWQKIEHYAINVLNENQEELSNRFARARGDKWEGLPPLFGKTGVPLLPNVLVAFECEAFARYEGGDHEVFIGRVVELHAGSLKHEKPLTFFQGRYRKLASHGPQHTPPGESTLLHGW